MASTMKEQKAVTNYQRQLSVLLHVAELSVFISVDVWLDFLFYLC